jgi:hypothetical protein
LVGRLAVFFYSVMLFIYIIYIYSLNGRLKKRWQPDSCQPCDKMSLDCMASLSMRGAQQKATDYDLNRVKLGKMLPCANTYHMHPQFHIHIQFIFIAYDCNAWIVCHWRMGNDLICYNSIDMDLWMKTPRLRVFLSCVSRNVYRQLTGERSIAIHREKEPKRDERGLSSKVGMPKPPLSFFV